MEREKFAAYLNPESDNLVLRQTAKTLLRVCKTKIPEEAAAKLLTCDVLDLSRDEWSAGGPAMTLEFLGLLHKCNGVKANFQKLASTQGGNPFGPLLRPNLRFLHLRGVSADAPLPVQEMAQCVELEELDLSQCEPAVVDPTALLAVLKTFSRLKILALAQLHLKDCSFVSDLVALESLDLSNNDLTKLPVMSALQSLRILKLAKNMLTDLEALSLLRRLRDLDFSENSVDSLVPLERLRELRTLRFGRNKVRDLKALRDLDMLETVSLSMNPVHEEEIEDVLGRRVRVD